MSHAPLSQAPHASTPFPRALIRFAATLTAVAALAAGVPADAAEQRGGAVLQFGLYGKEGEARWAWETMKRRKPELVNGLTADVVNTSGGVALRARAAAGTDGNALCRRIVGAGFGCLVIEQAPATVPATRSAETTVTTVKPTVKPSPAPAEAQPQPAPPVQTATAPVAVPTPVTTAPPAIVVPVAMTAPKAPEPVREPAKTITTAVVPPAATPPAPLTVAMAAPPAPSPAPAQAPAPAPAAQATPAAGLRFAPFAPAPAAPAKPAGAATHAGMPGHDGVFLYNDEEARVLREIEGRARVRGRLGAIIPDTKIDISPAVLKREGWNLCAVTFDDGPHRTVTRQILEILNQEKIVATYFPVGRVAAHYPDIIKEWVAAGHEIGNHSQTHADLRPLPAEAQRFEIAEANRILRTMGANPVLFRPPYGRYTLDLLAIAREEKMAPVLWNVDTRDWQMRDPDKIVQHVKTAAGTGSVLLMHSTYPSTAAALPRVISDLRAKGCQFVTLSEWIERMRNLAAPMMVNAAEPVVSAGAPMGGAPH